MLGEMNKTIEGKTFAVSGFGNVAWGAVSKINQLGGKVVTISGPDGYIYDPDGISGEKVDYMLELRESNNDIVSPYAERFGAQFFPDQKPWVQPVDIALPCATQNELDKEDAIALLKNGCFLVAEVSNMGCTSEAVNYFIENKFCFAPGKAVNAGGVSVSGLEMSQNSMRYNWTSEEVDKRLHLIMQDIHQTCKKFGQNGNYTNYVKGANVGGFVKVADAMLAQGLV
jgi:glutamate dehydrogenase (NADP+)